MLKKKKVSKKKKKTQKIHRVKPFLLIYYRRCGRFLFEDTFKGTYDELEEHLYHACNRFTYIRFIEIRTWTNRSPFQMFKQEDDHPTASLTEYCFTRFNLNPVPKEDMFIFE